ncbi:hypothetical protein GCM10011354_18810 [Egicoccus halophilus]|uniref:Prolyl aminopeptidase n=1 Tax=Egicoccus halophilus TaxID=1670830 RepID=A0A8J3A8D2_9ACTN|nr:hypothetical protein GCM10011354_18810 [Egicoccus halophilus]
MLLDGARALGRVPAVPIHGTLDLQAPLDNAWQLHRAWPGSDLRVVDRGGHGRGLDEAVVEALDRFAGASEVRR